jgi:hypothetical protein
MAGKVVKSQTVTDTIRDFLDHPNLRGRYTHLMPHYLFAVLVEKVATLRGMAVESM